MDATDIERGARVCAANHVPLPVLVEQARGVRDWAIERLAMSLADAGAAAGIKAGAS